MGVSKVVYGDDTLVDLTGDTVTPTSLTLGATAHGADGEPIVGEYQYVLPLMSSDIRGGARIQPDSGLEITDTDNLQVRLALESDSTVRGGIAELTAKGHAEQDGTPTPDNPVPIQVVSGRNLIAPEMVGPIGGTTGIEVLSHGVRVYAKASAAYLSSKTLCSTLGFVDGKTYTITSDVTIVSGVGAITVRGTNNSIVVGTGNITTSGKYSVTFTYDSSNHSYVSLFCTLDTAEAGNVMYDNLQINVDQPMPYVPYGHVGMEAQGRNLIYGRDVDSTPATRGYIASFIDGNTTRIVGTSTSSGDCWLMTGSNITNILGPCVLTFSVESTKPFPSGINVQVAIHNRNTGSWIRNVRGSNGARSITFALEANEKINIGGLRVAASGIAVNDDFHYMLELGSIQHDYQPYYHRTTALPLPSRGWVAGLPDGTADLLRLDGAGKCEWTLETYKTTLDSSLNWQNNERTSPAVLAQSTIGLFSNNFPLAKKPAQSSYTKILSNKFTSDVAHPDETMYSAIIYNGNIIAFNIDSGQTFQSYVETVEVLYPLATPVTEDCGYVEDWPTDIPEGATLSIRELDSVGIKYFIDSSVTELAKQWYARAQSEYADRLEALEAAVSEIIAG